MLLPVRSHTLAALAVTGAVIAVGGVATADSIDECVLSHRRGQELRQSGAVRAARAALVACGGTACPGPLRDDCVRWVAELDRQIPTLVVAARDAALPAGPAPASRCRGAPGRSSLSRSR